jgi:hypothetical protein
VRRLTTPSIDVIQIPRTILTSPLADIAVEPGTFLTSRRSTDVDNDRLVEVLGEVEWSFARLERRGRFRDIVSGFLAGWRFLAFDEAKRGVGVRGQCEFTR